MNPQTAVSPLRYPGGKQKLYLLVKLIIRKAALKRCIYVEPFAGGAGVALALLFDGTVDSVVINDFDKAVASIWKAILLESDRFIEKIFNVPLTIAEWKKQQNIYTSSSRYSFDFGFASFYLNRTNHSGILKGGPIGGFDQSNPAYKMSARFNRVELAKKIAAIKEHKDKIKCYNQNAKVFICNQLPQIGKKAFIYFDPPYYNKGRRLYKDYFVEEDHKELARLIRNYSIAPWIVSYDDVPAIREMYSRLTARTFTLSYSLANSGHGQEIMFFKDKTLCPSDAELKSIKVDIANWR